MSEGKISKFTTYKFLVLRLIIGGFFIAVGLDKVLEPHQNFLYVIQGYQIFPELLENIAAYVFPWIELFLGLFLFLGLWLKWILRGFLLMISAFILIISQALVRKLPIEFCGCFGGLFSSDIHQTLILDVFLWLFVFLMMRFIAPTSFLSLDKYFSRQEK
ncbi:MAG: DoxX family membrane protein [Candidatus Omnitrophica bacterium]|nr:DoxX family membrane protein [Candidatus Omnitrophota bacterium]